MCMLMKKTWSGSKYHFTQKIIIQNVLLWHKPEPVYGYKSHAYKKTCGARLRSVYKFFLYLCVQYIICTT